MSAALYLCHNVRFAVDGGAAQAVRLMVESAVVLNSLRFTHSAGGIGTVAVVFLLLVVFVCLFVGGEGSLGAFVQPLFVYCRCK